MTSDSAGSRERVARTESADDDRWITTGSAVEAPLPDDVRSKMRAFLGAESVETIGEWTDEFKSRTAGGSMDPDDLCHSGEETEHWGEVDGERQYFRCFYDALLLSELTDEPVDIRTKGPDGTIIEARADGADDLTVSPEGTVVSFGISTEAEPEEPGSPTLEETYSAICPYVKAFPDREAYEQWADSVDAVTVAMPLMDATDAAGRMLE